LNVTRARIATNKTVVAAAAAIITAASAELLKLLQL